MCFLMNIRLHSLTLQTLKKKEEDEKRRMEMDEMMQTHEQQIAAKEDEILRLRRALEQERSKREQP